MEIFRAKTRADAAEAAGEAINEFLGQNLKTSILFLLSGGSALEIADYIDEKLLGDNITLSVADERFSAEPQVNNFAQVQNTSLYKLAQEKGVNFIGTLPRSGETLAQISQRFEQALRSWRQENPEGKIITTLGMGPDGHTAGVFPLPTEETKFNQLFLSEAWVTGYNNDGQKPLRERFTTTLSFFGQINRAIIFVMGKEKQSALKRVLKNQDEIYVLPALAWHKIKSAEIFTDII